MHNASFILQERKKIRAQREAAAARKAAQQAAREQWQAQRDLARAEARKAEAQVRLEILGTFVGALGFSWFYVSSHRIPVVFYC